MCFFIDFLAVGMSLFVELLRACYSFLLFLFSSFINPKHFYDELSNVTLEGL